MRRFIVLLAVLLSIPFTSPNLARALSYAESFTHADGAFPLTADNAWSQVNDTGWQISSNRANMSSAGHGPNIRADVDTATSDQVATVTLVQTIWSSGEVDPCLFIRKDSSATVTFYALCAKRTGASTGLHKIIKYIAGVETILASDSVVPADGETWSVQAVGTSIQATYNSTTLGPVTDSSISTGTRSGLGAYCDAGGTVNFDNWTLADVAGGGGTILQHQGLPMGIFQ